MLYTPNDEDTVQQEHEVPLPDAGAPLPSVVEKEGRLVLAYYGEFDFDPAAGTPAIMTRVASLLGLPEQ